MRFFSKFFCSILASGLIFSSPKKDNLLNNNDKEKGLLTIVFDNVAGDQNMVLNTASYTNATGEKFTVSQLQYFISNIKLRRTDGTIYTYDQDKSYFLVKESNPSSQKIELKIPTGDYDQLMFVLGVDSARNVMDVSKRTGVLDPANSLDDGMYWSWNSGYIFFKMEGTSPAAPVDPTGENKFRYHIGGFGGYSARTINNIKTISIDLPQTGIIKLNKDKKTKAIIKADILKVFNGAVNLSIAAHPNVMFGEYSVNIANNYSNMFAYDRTEN